MSNIQHNALQQRYAQVSNMRGIQSNQLLNNSGKIQIKSNDPSGLRSVILDQRRPDPKMDMSRFNKIASTLDGTHMTEREKLWASRTNQPYKNILPVSDFKKEYKTKEELVVYKVEPKDKDEKLFETKVMTMRQAVAKHDKELKDTFSLCRKGDFEKTFEYNHIEKYNVKYNPTDFNGMKDNIVDYYKKEQLEQEKERKCIDDVIENMMAPNIDGGTIPQEGKISPGVNDTQNERDETDDKSDKYKRRQKKL